MTQEGEDSVSRDGSGQIFDELAEERLAEITEVGPELEAEGAESLDPGVRDVSERLVEGKPHGLIHGEPIDEDAVLEGNVEEIKDETGSPGTTPGWRRNQTKKRTGKRTRAARDAPRIDEARERGFSTFRG